MSPRHGHQIVEALRECALFLVRATQLLLKRPHGHDGRARNAKTRAGRKLSGPTVGLLVVSLLLALHAVPGGSGGGLLLSEFGACEVPALAGHASCGRFDPAPASAQRTARIRAYDPERDDAVRAAAFDPLGSMTTIGELGVAPGGISVPVVRAEAPALDGNASAAPGGEGADTEKGDAAAAGVGTVRVGAADLGRRAAFVSPARSAEHGSLARDRDLSAAAVARAPASTPKAVPATRLVQVSLY